MSLSIIVVEDRRLRILMTLGVSPGYKLNEQALQLVLRTEYGHNVTRDVLRGDVSWLRDQGLVKVVKQPNGEAELWVPHLEVNGLDVANGAEHPGVARPRP